MFASLFLVATSAAVCVPSLIFAAECLLSPKTDEGGLPPGEEGLRPPLAVLIPAHNESASIGRVVALVLSQCVPGDRAIVVADNCDDDTAAIARAAGAEVIERHDKERRGKGYAISFGVEHLKTSPPSVVVIVDADCELEAGALGELASAAHRLARPIQADYLLGAPEAASSATRLVAFAVLVKNRVRPAALARFGLPCQLTGSGMAFPWEVLANAKPMEGAIVEDMALGIELTLKGVSPLYLGRARVHSELPVGGKGAKSQRSRWETGHLATLVKFVPPLLWSGVRKGRLADLALGMDLAVPPLALLGVAQGAVIVVATGVGLASGFWAPLLVSTVSSGGAALGAYRAWSAFGRETVSASELALIPGYVLSKLPLYLRVLRRGADKDWVRTARRAEEPSSS